MLHTQVLQFFVVTGLGYTVLTSYYGGAILSNDDIGTGLISAVVSQYTMGLFGQALYLFGVIALGICSLVAEVIAISTVLTVDLYREYWRVLHTKNTTYLSLTNAFACCL